MIKPESIENLKSIIDIVDVISNYLELKKVGSNFKALCPFHSEKTPSFVVSPAKQIYHCFGCHASGDAIKFVMEIEKLSYKEAIEKLASLYNFKLEYTSNAKGVDTNLLEIVNNFYIQELYKNKEALSYLKNRGVNDSTIEKFKLGYAPNKEKQFEFFKKANLDLNALKELGVVSEKNYPRLIERITFPIFSTNNKIIAMGGRTISGHVAKYINFTNTKIFNKSKTFYGLNFAREHILRKKEAIIVEGYMDVIMLHQAQINTSIATLGTALTNEHLPLLKKLSSKILLAYDSDEAGINAAIKASKLLFKSFFEGGVILFPLGLDPADVIKKNEDINIYLKNTIPFLDFIIEYSSKKYNLKNPVQKKLLIDELKEYIFTLPEILKENFIEKCAQFLQISPKLLSTKKNFLTQAKTKKIDIAEASIIKTLYENPNIMNEVVEYLPVDVFKTHQEELQAIYQEDFNNPKLLDIILRENIITLDYETLKKQIIKLLIPYYQEKILKLKYSNIDMETKMHKLKELNLKILNLKKGIL